MASPGSRRDSEPKGQPRQRAFVRGGRAAVYDPGTAEGWKGAVAAALHGHAGRCVGDPLRVDITFYFPRAKGHFGKRGLLGSAPLFHLKKPDADNAAKAVLDALSEGSGIGLWKDDTQVVDLVVRKRWADLSPARAQIDIYRYPEPNPPSGNLPKPTAPSLDRPVPERDSMKHPGDGE